MRAMGRFLLLPAVALATAGTALESVRNSIPTFAIPDEVKSGFGSVFDFFKSEVDAMRAVMAQSKKETPSTSAPSTSSAAASSAAAPAEPKKLSEKELAEREAERVKQVMASPEYAELQKKVAELEAALFAEKEQAEVAHEREKAEHSEEVARLQAENQDLRRAVVLDDVKASSKPGTKRPIDIFSEIMDLRAKADSAFNAHDHLPRVVVVGDQSAGKTSVLEVLVRAHIFPRGAGEMMTRAPIQVTLSEGPRHVARIKGSDREYDLTNAQDLTQIRKDIERRMIASIAVGEVISNETLALDVRGPGLNPMVLVDLPGIIQHHTQGMASTTKGSIMDMCRQHIHNPNSIILCIQDASRDAEGSSVADIVHEADPSGARTIFVLTKVDLAEQLKFSPAKMKSILKGQRFNMKAKAYFAVVTGTSNPNDSVDAIRTNERKYFERSQFVKDGSVTPRQTGVDNLSKAVSEAFWERVKDTVSQETKEVALSLRRKENEWKNTYPGQARQSRDDLFYAGRTLVLDNMAKVSSSQSVAEADELLRQKMQDATLQYFLINVYQRASETEDIASFRTVAQNMLDDWVSGALPQLSIDAARLAVMDELNRMLDVDDAEHTFVPLAQHLKASLSQLKWNPHAAEKLHHIQEFAFSDDAMKSRRDWEEAANFMARILLDAHDARMGKYQKLLGPSWTSRWTHWTSLSAEETANRAVFAELQPLFNANMDLRSSDLSAAEMTAVLQNVKLHGGLTVERAHVEKAFKLLYELHFLARARESAAYCHSRWGAQPAENKPVNGLQCADVSLFWRYHNMLQHSSNVLRVESTEYRKEAQETIRHELDELSSDPAAKQTLLGGKRVVLSEEIEILRHIQSKLDSFVKALKKE